MVSWIVGIGALMAAGAIVYLAFSGDLHLHMVIATLGGVFFSVVLGCGLMAAAFFSDKSGHDRELTHATSDKKDGWRAHYRTCLTRLRAFYPHQMRTLDRVWRLQQLDHDEWLRRRQGIRREVVCRHPSANEMLALQCERRSFDGRFATAAARMTAGTVS